MTGIKKKLNSENGMVIVEATFVFPVMFIILFIIIYMGNAYYQKAIVENVVTEYAIKGANYCADPVLAFYKENGVMPGYKDLKTQPYRYVFGGMSDIENQIGREVKQAIEDSPTFFAGMTPKVKTSQAQIASFNNAVLYATFSVDVNYVIEFPIRFLYADNPVVLSINSRAEVPVNDTAEFIRNTDMVMDLLEGTKAADYISNVFGKINDFINTFSEK